MKNSTLHLTLLLSVFLLGAAAVRSPSDLVNQAKRFEAEKQYDGAIAAYQELLQLRPDDDAARAALARLLSWTGQYEQAVRLYREILERYPTDLEIKTALARVLSWQKQFAESRALYDAVLQEDPNNVEAQRGVGDIFEWTGESQQALRVYKDLYERTKDPEMAAKIKAIESKLEPALPYRDYLKLGYGHFTHSNRFPNEREWQIEAAKPLGDQTWIARVERLNRFGKVDVPISMDLFSPLWAKASGFASVGGTPRADFAPKIYVAGELSQGLGVLHPVLSFLEPSIGFRWMSFPGTKVELLIPGWTLYFPNDVWLNQRVYYVPDANTVTVSSQLNWQIDRRIRVFGALAFGRTAESLGTLQDFQKTPTRSFRLGGVLPISARISTEAWGYYEARKELYVRRGGSMQLIYHW